MKKIILSLLVCSALFIANAQENETANDESITNTYEKDNEVKLNALFLVVGAFNVTYERLLNEESGAGIEIFVPFDSDIDINYYVSPYYRFYFGKKYAAGFFLEGFGMLNSREVSNLVFFDNFGNITSRESEDETNFALGIGLGGKWVTKSGFVGELSLGIGRNIISSDFDNEIVGKVGITVGYRF